MMNMAKMTAGFILLAAAGHAQAHDMGQGETFSMLSLDRLEARSGGAYWEGQGWVGGDLDKVWFKTEGEREDGRLRAADVELLYSRAVAPYWDAQVGVRHDFGADGRDWAAFAFKGTAPYRFDVDASLYLGAGGAAARLKSGYALLLTQRLALLPELEANFYGKSDSARATGAGLSNLDVSLRLRYEVSREFAPYLGIVWSNRYGSTAAFARRDGEAADSASWVAGVRLWW